MSISGLITRGECLRLVAIWVALVLLSAAFNVPFAINRIHPRSMRMPGKPIIIKGEAAAAHGWPSATPHKTSWPSPDSIDLFCAFGFRGYNAFARSSTPGVNGFQMEVEHMGWPWPVLELKQMWWNWDDPALKGPDNSPPLRLLPLGIVLNPLMVGTGLFLATTGWRTLVIVSRRGQRSRDGRCIHCGYAIETASLRCPECGKSPRSLMQETALG